MKHKLEVKEAAKSFGNLSVIEDISFNVENNEFVSIIGPSGCGKTTLLYLIAGFIQKSKGEISLDGNMGFVFQDINLFPWKTVSENIEVGPINRKLPEKEINRITSDLLIEFGLSEFKGFFPSQISEGMKQKVGIARCLANNPEILLMDEPFASLDYLTRLKMQDFLLKVKSEHNLTILFVTHDIDEAIRLSDRIIILSKRPAKINEILNVKNFKDKNLLKKHILSIIEI